MALRQSKKGLPKKAESDEDVDEKASTIEDNYNFGEINVKKDAAP